MAAPRGLPIRYRLFWAQPWRESAKRSSGFRKWLDANGYLSPNYTIREAASKDGVRLPGLLRKRARDHAFNLEKLARRLGVKKIPVLSWYRSAARNAAVGGARDSRHMRGDATDHTREWVARVGRARLLKHAEAIFKNGGLGKYSSGSVHFDSRGKRARW